MTIDESPEYYRLREARERELAAEATSERVRYIHESLADRYKELAEEAENRG